MFLGMQHVNYDVIKLLISTPPTSIQTVTHVPQSLSSVLPKITRPLLIFSPLYNKRGRLCVVFEIVISLSHVNLIVFHSSSIYSKLLCPSDEDDDDELDY